jgi:hypothetical protein
VVRAAFADAGFLPGAIPAIGLFDVLEHIEDQHRFLASLAGCLIPGGRIYVTVPASRWLWSREALDAGHFRRYGVAELSRAIEDAGLAVRRVPPYRLGFPGVPPTLERVRADHQAAGSLASRVLRIFDRPRVAPPPPSPRVPLRKQLPRRGPQSRNCLRSNAYSRSRPAGLRTTFPS